MSGASSGGQAQPAPMSRRAATGERGHTRVLEYPPAPEPLPVPCYDNHTHLEIEDGEGLALAEHMDRAAAAGIAGAITVGGDVASSRWCVQAAERDARVLAAVAIHPNEAPVIAADTGDRASALRRLDAAIDEIDALAEHPAVRAVGETGLDFFRTGPEQLPWQFHSFERHIEIAKRRDLAMQIHDRDAHDAVLSVLAAEGAPRRTVFHCFSGDEAMARIAAEEGWYLSFAGTVTFKNAQGLRDALRVTPRERILVETDAPFLTPVPFRGRPNAPYLVPVTVRFMAAELGADLAELTAQIARNTIEAYGAWPEPARDAGGAGHAGPGGAGAPA